jgi:hypothetical protein
MFLKVMEVHSLEVYSAEFYRIKFSLCYEIVSAHLDN